MEYWVNILLLFFIYGFAGWCMEVILKYRQFHRFINRGFLTGPLLPIYGGGAILITVIIGNLTSVESGFVMTFALSFVICGFVEYLTSLVLEKIKNLPYETKAILCVHREIQEKNVLLKRDVLQTAIEDIHISIKQYYLNLIQNGRKKEVIDEFIKNHICRYNISMGAEEQTVTMMNKKNVKLGTISEGTIEEENVDKMNVSCSNGVVHVIDGYLPYQYNIYEFLAKDWRDNYTPAEPLPALDENGEAVEV